MAPSLCCRCALLLTMCLTFAGAALAGVPADQVLPATTKGAVIIPSLSRLDRHWVQTQLAQLVSDPVMKPFVEDLQHQLQNKMARTGVQLGIRLGELGEASNSEAALAMIQPGGDKDEHALAIVLDVSGRREAAQQLVRRTVERLGGATTVDVDGAQVLRAQIPGGDGEPPHAVYYCLRQDRLIVTDHRVALDGILQRCAGQGGPSLADLPAYRNIRQRVAGDRPGDIVWYVDLFGFFDVNRAATGKGDGHTSDMLAEQGFDGIQALGGQIELATGEHEILHRTFVYTPLGVESLRRAARMLDFPNSAETAKPRKWVPAGVSNQLEINVNIKGAFEASKTLVNAIAGDDVFDDVLQTIATDPKGPQIDIRREIIDHLGTRVSLVSDHRLPIEPDSERILISVEVLNEPVVALALSKWMASEQNFRRHTIDGREVWEYVPPADREQELTVIIEGTGFETAAPAPPEPKESLMPHAAVTIANGHLIVSTHLDYLTDIVRRPVGTAGLDTTADFLRTGEALERLGAGLDSFRMFTRTAGALEVTYELIRQGRMPESKSLLGMALAALHGDGPRRQAIDGSKLPGFEFLRPYLGPHGLFVQSESQGWFISGCLLSAQPN